MNRPVAHGTLQDIGSDDCHKNVYIHTMNRNTYVHICK